MLDFKLSSWRNASTWLISNRTTTETHPSSIIMLHGSTKEYFLLVVYVLADTTSFWSTDSKSVLIFFVARKVLKL